MNRFTCPGRMESNLCTSTCFQVNKILMQNSLEILISEKIITKISLLVHWTLRSNVTVLFLFIKAPLIFLHIRVGIHSSRTTSPAILWHEEGFWLPVD